MKAKTKIKTLLLGATLATAFATVGAYGLSTEYETFNPTTITADAASTPYSGTPVEPTKITSENLASYGLVDSYVGYYAIKTAEELAWFASYIDKGSSGDLTASAILLDDIIYNAGTVTESGSSLGTTHNWNPIGDWGKDWSGTFDGNGHFVSGLYAKRTWSYTGFIAYTNGATVKNLTIKNSYFQDGLYLGGIVGFSQNGTTITGCRVESSVTVNGVSSSGADWIGGIVGKAEDTTITNCYVAATVSGDRLTGAISGDKEGVVTMSNNYYVTGCTTAKGVPQNAVGRNSSTGEALPDVAGQNTSIASESSEHTCVPAQSAEVAGVYDAYTYCSVCYEVLSITHNLSYATASERIYPNGAGDTSTYYDNYTITETCANCSHSETAQFRFVEGTSRVYTGEAITPYEIVYSDNYVQKETGAPTYTDNVNVGVATVSRDFYDIGAVSLSFTIEKATPKAADFVITPPADLTYNGEQKTASASIRSGIVGMGDITAVIYKDGVATTEIVEAGEYTVKISATEGDNYTAIDDLTVGSFTVQPRWISVGDVTLSNDLVEYNGEVQEPTVSVVVDGKTLVWGTEYDLSWNKTGFVNADTYAVTVIGKGNYQGGVTVDYLIVPKSIEDSEIAIDVTEVTYDGNAHEPTITVKDGAKTLVKDTDYTLTWDKSGFVNADTYTATVEGINNYDGTYMRTLVIHKETLVVELSAPILKVLPGNQIALTLTVNSTEGTPVWNVVGGTYVSGTTVKIDDSLVIGQDKVTITVTYAATTNYTDGSKTIELEVGMADFTSEINTLEEDVSDLQALIADKADSAIVNQKLNELLGKIEALEAVKEDYKGADQVLEQSLTQAIDNAKQEAVNAAQTNLDNAVIDLNNTMATEDGKLDSRITQEVADLNDAIATARQFATDSDTALQAAIEAADGVLMTAIKAVQTNLDNAVIDLNNTIATEDGKLDNRITQEVADLNDAIDLAEQVAEQANDDLKANLETQLATAQTALTNAINAVQSNLDNAVIDLNNTIATEDGKLDNRITQEVADLNNAIDLAEQVAQQANDDLQANLETQLATAQTALTNAINAVQDNLDNAVDTLNDTIDSGDDRLAVRITREVKDLNAAIDLAEQVAAQADASLKADLEEQLATAEEALAKAIDAVQANLDSAVENLQAIIESGDEALAADLAEAIDEVNAAIDLAKDLSKESDEALEAELTAAQEALEKNLKTLIRANSQGIKDARKAAKRGDILPTVLGSVGVAGNLGIAIVWMILKRRKIK